MKNLTIKLKRDIPAVEKLAVDDLIIKTSGTLVRPLVVEIIRSVVDKTKDDLGVKFREITYDNLRNKIISEIQKYSKKKIGRVINGTGILVHTNLGRAPLSDALFDAIKANITGYGNLEFDVISGKRGKRGELAERYLALLSESEAGTIVNNNAAALFLILNTLANRKKVVISRGELIQIGGGFRIPDIIKKSGAKLLEIGTTNITTFEDYKTALENKPAVILKVHRSNFAQSGFTGEVGIKELVALGKEYNMPVVNDLGSGVFIDTSEFARLREPTVQGSVHHGVSLTCFSGDKLLGGVQSGLIVGQKDLINRIKQNPIYRIVRVDKTVFSSLEKLLGYYLEGSWRENIKLWRLAEITLPELRKRGEKLLREIRAGDKISLEESQGRIGGGALPEIPLPSIAVIFRSKLKPQKIAAMFRETNPAVIGRVTNENFTLDLKAIDDEDFEILARIIGSIIHKI